MDALKFMKAWKKICIHHVFCEDCDLHENCVLYEPGFWDQNVEDKIVNLIDAVKDIEEGWNEI